MARNRLICPVCNEKLPGDKDAEENSEGHMVRLRKCPCGYSRRETIIEHWKEFFPESAPIPTPQHPGEGGYGYTKKE